MLFNGEGLANGANGLSSSRSSTSDGYLLIVCRTDQVPSEREAGLRSDDYSIVPVSPRNRTR